MAARRTRFAPPWARWAQVRTLTGARLVLPSSLSTLRMASQLRRQGQVPAALQLWAVANPNVEPDASLAEQKVGSVCVAHVR